jgi:hypothetical protein
LGGIDKDRHRPWLGYALEESLRRSLYSAKDVIAHASPEVLVAQLPPQLISELIARALASGTFSPAQVIETAPPELMAAYLDPALIWHCLRDVADRSGLSKKGASRAAPARQWLAAVLQRALESELISAADVLRFLPPSELVSDSTRAVVAELIKNALVRGSFDAGLVLQHLTPSVIADNLEASLAWACISEAVTRGFDISARPDDHNGAIAATPPPVAAVPAAPYPPAVAAAAAPPASAPVPVPAPGVVPARATFKPSDKDKMFEQTVMDKSSAPAAAPKPKAAPSTATPAPAARPPATPPRPAAPRDSDWRPGDELDIVDEEELPPTRARG